MSAGICLLNRNGVVLAADSAVTIGNHATVFNSANKVHKMSDSNPVGAVIYSNACFESIPFEIIISDYRKYLGAKHFDDLDEYVDDFISFIESKSDEYGHEDNEVLYLNRILNDVFCIIKNKQKKLLKDKNELEECDYDAIVSEILGEIENFKTKDSLSLSDNIEKHKQKFAQDYSANPEFSEFGLQRIFKIIDESCELMKSDYEVSGYVGIAVCGFGNKNIFPKCKHILLLGVCNGKINYRIKDNISINAKTVESILPLAQSDVMTTFLFNTNVDSLNNLKVIIKNKASQQISSYIANKTENELEEMFENLSKEIVNDYIEELKNK